MLRFNEKLAEQHARTLICCKVRKCVRRLDCTTRKTVEIVLKDDGCPLQWKTINLGINGD